MVLFAGFLVFLLALFWETFAKMASVWGNSENFSHGWLIAPISLWLIWQHRRSLTSTTWKVSWLGCVAIVFCALAWLAGELAGVSVVKSIAVVLIVPSAVLLFGGWSILRLILFPLMFLLCMVPAGEGLTPILMEHTATFTVWAVKATGVPIFREGMHFTLPTGQWSVVEACSGLRYFIAAFILALLFAYLNFSSVKRKILFICSCLLLSILANWLRAYLIVMLGHLSNMKYGVGDDHIVYGWIFFGIVMMLIFWVGGKFGDKPEELPLKQTAARIDKRFLRWNMSSAIAFVCAATILIGAVIAPGSARNFSPSNRALGQLQADLKLQPLNDFVVPTKFEDPLERLHGQLPSESKIEIVYFARQDKNKDMLAYGQRLLPEVSSSFVELTKGMQSDLKLEFGRPSEHIVRIGVDRWILLQWFVIGDTSVGSVYAAKAMRLLNLLRGQGDHSFSVVIGTKITTDQSASEAILKRDAVLVSNAFKQISLK
jgi:exosortase A